MTSRSTGESSNVDLIALDLDYAALHLFPRRNEDEERLARLKAAMAQAVPVLSIAVVGEMLCRARLRCDEHELSEFAELLFTRYVVPPVTRDQCRLYADRLVNARREGLAEQVKDHHGWTSALVNEHKIPVVVPQRRIYRALCPDELIRTF